jgi:predicted metal-dependent peptidase
VEDLCTRAEQFADHVKKLARSSESDWNRFLTRELGYAKHNLKVLKQRNHQRSQQFHPELRQWLKSTLGRI